MEKIMDDFIIWLTFLITIAAVIYIVVRRPFDGTAVKDAADDSDPLPGNRSGKTKEHSIDEK